LLVFEKKYLLQEEISASVDDADALGLASLIDLFSSSSSDDPDKSPTSITLDLQDIPVLLSSFDSLEDLQKLADQLQAEAAQQGVLTKNGGASQGPDTCTQSVRFKLFFFFQTNFLFLFLSKHEIYP